MIFRTFSAPFNWFLLTRGDAPRGARRLPLAIIFRAFGAAKTEWQRHSTNSFRRKLMRLIYLAVILTVLFPVLGSAQSTKQKAAIEQEVKRLDVEHADAILRGDLAALDKLWTT